MVRKTTTRGSSLAGLALLCALVNLPARAIETLDDDDLSDTSAQSGVTLSTNVNLIKSTLTYQDPDGLGNASSTTSSLSSSGHLNMAPTYVNGSGVTVSGTGSAGDLNIRDLSVFTSTVQAGMAYTNAAANAAPVVTRFDVGSDAAHSGTAQIEVSVPQVNMSFSGIDTCKATVSPTSGPCAASSAYPVFATSGTTYVVAQNLDMNIRFGAAAHGHLAVLSGGGSPISLTIGSQGGVNSISVSDPNNPHVGFSIGTLSITGIDLGNGSDITHSTTVDVCSNTSTTDCPGANQPGLLISFGTNTMGGGLGAAGVSILAQNVVLGDLVSGAPAVIGSMGFSNMNLGGTTLRIVGH